ncbi:MAG TPA: hypothetical protein VMH61_02640 [Candidatus Acidoferrales bacterium]|nr:hypothetical protein [Candidatus Acidoferrales bacterium]
MSSPPLRAPAPLRWIAWALVAVAVVVRLAWHASPPRAPRAGAPPAARAAAAAAPSAPAPRFGAAVGFRSRARLAEHFAKHGAEVHAASADDYLRLAQALRDRPAGGDVLEEVRGDGVTCRFDRASGAFLAFESDGTIRTFFRPSDGERYFERQLARPHDGS